MIIDVAVATLCFDGFGDEDFGPTFARIGELGVRNVEFNTWYPRNLTPAGLDRIAARCADAGLTPVTLQVSPFAAGDGFGDLTRETTRWLWLLEAARRVGVTMIKATGSRRGERGGLAGLIAVLQEIAPHAAAAGIRIAIENHFRNVVEFPEDYRQIFAAVPEPAIGACLDTGHFAASGVDMIRFIDDFHDRIIHVDLKDAGAPGTDRFVRFGEGVVDFAAVLGHARDRGYAGQLIIELPLIDRSTVIDDLRAGLAVARPYLTAGSAGHP
ncbi:sugar phosphate isomerase/epimerase family protein [Microlunatus sp. GCM10028923]|uniref:sugar phosphate isomerase/epimerase family protein n=1 Tax=Microlunatus sp. GCM10028923 TaxID=3273400 RepID=UPI00360CCBE3